MSLSGRLLRLPLVQGALLGLKDEAYTGYRPQYRQLAIARGPICFYLAFFFEIPRLMDSGLSEMEAVNRLAQENRGRNSACEALCAEAEKKGVTPFDILRQMEGSNVRKS
jgi:hypothetical protein